MTSALHPHPRGGQVHGHEQECGMHGFVRYVNDASEDVALAGRSSRRSLGLAHSRATVWLTWSGMSPAAKAGASVGFGVVRYTRFTPNLALRAVIKQHRTDNATY